ncbi:hypothetical protein CAPTEDRAFT_220163 [Capitella teleta]|uniref:Protein kinase domain-containing protein n=1 Tax=Capitella teleta TaxID=283909 RepID=R7T365_CAPTE|nr:hypothetical protein CAPTEDRAFT_220163 [Capitella teleta]|eukprot:ELT87102.1 hypothetical protein CAPTEDRAFT_220163 [Capitella teleta]
MFSLGMTLLYAAEYNASSAKRIPMDPELSALVLSMTKEEFESSTVRLGSQSSLGNISPRWQSSGSNDSLALPPTEFMDNDTKRLIRENNTEKLKEPGVRAEELRAKEFKGVGTKGSAISSDFRVSVSSICDELNRGLEEQEAWALCHQAIFALKSIREEYPAYICLDTVAISASTGNVHFLSMPDDKELDITFLAPELQQQAIVTPKTCLYGVGALLWAATDYKTTKGQSSLSSQMEMLLIIMTQNEADARPSLDEVREICEDQEKIASFKSKSVCLELAAQIRFKRQSPPEVLERPMSPLPDFTPQEKVVMEIRAGRYKLRKSSKPKVLSPQEIFMNDKDLMQSLQNVITQTPRPASTFKPNNCTGDADIAIPSAFQSHKTHFKPIIVKQHKQNAKDRRKTKSSNSLPNIETPVDELKEEASLQGTHSTSNLSPAFPYQVQLQHDPTTGFYQVIPMVAPPRASSQPLMVSAAPSPALVVTHSLIAKAKERNNPEADENIKKTMVRPKSSSGVHASMQRKTFDAGLNNDQPMSKSDPNLDLLESNCKQVQRPRRRRGDHCFSPDLPLSPVPSPSLSKDSGVSGIHLKGCGDPALLEKLLDSQNMRHNRRLQQVIRVVRDEFAFGGIMETGVEDVQMAEYIMSLCGLTWDTFVSAISEKFFDLYWEEGILVSLFECVNGRKPMPTEGDYPEDLPEDILPLPLPGPEPQQKAPRVNQASTAAWDEKENRKERERVKSTRREQKHKSPTRFRQNSVTPQLQEQLKEENEALFDSLNEQPSSPNGNNTKRNIIFVKSSSIEDNINDIENNVNEENEDTPRSSPPPRPSLSLGSSDSFPMMRSHKMSVSAEDHEEFAFDSDDEPMNHVTIIRNSKSIWGDICQISKLKVEEAEKLESPRERRTSHVICSSTDNSDIAVDVMPDTCWQRVQGSAVIYHWVEILQRSNVELNGFIAEMENSNKETIELTMCDIDQEFAMEQRNRKRTFNYYCKLLAASKKGRISSDQKGMLNRVIQELSDNKDRLEFLELARKHLETMYAECFGMDPSVLLALIKCSPKEPMLLSMADANPHLQVQMNMDGKRFLQAGTCEGLMASLFAKGALSNGFIHQFLYGFRYFVAPLDLLSFICDKYTASSQSLAPAVGMPAKVKVRAIDLLQAWLEGYFSIDFRNSRGMLQTLKTFLKSREEDDCLKKVRLSLDRCMKGQNYELVPAPETPSLNLFQDGPTSNLKSEVKIKADVQWENFQYSLALGKNCSKTGGPMTTAVPLHRPSRPIGCKKSSRKSDAFNLADFTAEYLAEQLTLMEQVGVILPNTPCTLSEY